MPLFRKLSDEEQIAKWDEEVKQMLLKNYDLLIHQREYPSAASLLKPDKLQAVSYEQAGNNAYIHIGYRNSFSSYITDTVRVNYDRIYKGTLICSKIKHITELAYNPKSNIKHSLFSNYKELTIPIGKEKSLYIQCKEIFIDNFDIYVFHNDNLILEKEYRGILKKQIESN